MESLMNSTTWDRTDTELATQPDAAAQADETKNVDEAGCNGAARSVSVNNGFLTFYDDLI